MTHEPPPDDPDIEGSPAGADWLDESAHPSPDDDLPKYRVKPRIDDDDPRPEIRLSQELHEVTLESIAALAGMRVNGNAEPHGVGDPRMFQREGKLVSVARYEPPPGKDFIPKGTPYIFEVTTPTLALRLSKTARFYRRAKPSAQQKAALEKGYIDALPEQWDRVTPPPNIVSMVLDHQDYPGVRPLVGVSETPMLRPDGTLAWPERDRATYDWVTRYVLVPGLNIPSIPDSPTSKDAKRALAILREPFADFPYASPAHQMVPIAAILTLLARPAILGACPAFIFDAATRGSGKTKQCDVVSMIALGRIAPRATFPHNDEELEKVLSAYAIHGSQLILLDNVTRQFGGGPLDKVLTAEDTVDLRVLGKTEIRSLVWRAVILASGNNMTLAEDTIRRSIVARLESRLEHPERRTDFKHSNLLAWVRTERPKLIAAALTLLRSWFVAGSPTLDCLTDSAYAAWAGFIPCAIRWGGGEDVLTCRPQGAEAMTDELSALATFLRELPRLGEGRPMTSRQIVEALWPSGGRDHDEGPDGWDEMRGAIEVLAPTRGIVTPTQRAHSLGRGLGKRTGRVLQNKRLAVSADGEGIRAWRVEAVQ